jgi:nicotinamidase/pyrazinamidase
MTDRSLFWDVDTQHDFMRATGKLYVGESEAIIPNLAALTDYAHQRGIRIVASADDHEPGHRELSDAPDFRESFPEHCMRGTPGQRKIPETTLRDPLVIEPDQPLPTGVRAHAGDFLLHKHWFDVFTNPHVLPLLDLLDPSDIVLYGVALDVCNRYAIEGLLRHRPGGHIHLVTDATRAISPESSAALLSDWERRGVTLVTTADVLAGRVV